MKVCLQECGLGPASQVFLEGSGLEALLSAGWNNPQLYKSPAWGCCRKTRCWDHRPKGGFQHVPQASAGFLVARLKAEVSFEFFPPAEGP